MEAGESNAEIARRLGMNLTTVAHHLSLLDLPPVLEHALATGRCTSPRTLHELSQMHDAEPDMVRALIDGHAAITRAAVTAMKAAERVVSKPAPTKDRRKVDAIARAHAACDRLEKALSALPSTNSDTTASPDLAALRARLEKLARHWSPGG